MPLIRVAVLALLALVALPVQAGPAADVVATCLADNTSGKDRKDLARWIFVAMAAHPEIREMANVPPASGEATAQAVGQLVTRLVTDTCAREFKALVKSEGPQAMAKAFETLGALAMQELLSNRDVTTSIGSFERYIDRVKLAQVLEQK